ncbi:MAG: WbqC family protein [Dorea sp.]|nr:WbqC family protein [Dorea sp.]
MILGMMQPYFFPYLGYWQLMNMADEYIIYDDVNFIKNGWIHRNRIKINGEPAFFNLGLKKASQNKRINEIELNMDDAKREALINKLQCNYAKAPYFKEVMVLFKEIIYCPETNLAAFLANLTRKVAAYMGIQTPIYSITELGLDHNLTAEDRIYEICHQRGCDTYINAIGGTELYDKEEFKKEGITLGFLRMDSDITYPQGKGQFLPGLSILDVLMYNSPEEVQELLKRYTLE